MRISTRTIVISVLCVFAVVGSFSISSAAKNGTGLYIGTVLQAPFSWIARPFVWIGDFFRNMGTADAKIASLEQRVQALSARIASYEQASQDAAFAHLLQQSPVPAVVSDAHLLGFVFGTGGSQFVIDAGSDQGIAQDDWVLLPQKILVGKVSNVRKNTSVVVSLYDSDLKIAALISNQVPGLFSFRQGQFVIDYIPSGATIATGTIAQTSGQDGLFAKGFLLGTVRSVHAVSDASAQEALLDPLFSLDQAHNVIVMHNSLKP